MTKQQILNEVETSNWQPKFKFTDNLDAVVDSILQPNEDYFLDLHSKVKEIITRETEFYNNKKDMGLSSSLYPEYNITFADVCNWQKELFEHKAILRSVLIFNLSNNPKLYDEIGFEEEEMLFKKTCDLPNQYINLGLRQINVNVGKWAAPHPLNLENLKQMCFPLQVKNGLTINQFITPCLEDNSILETLTKWYKIFVTIHFFEDLNERLGDILINIISYILTGKYLIKTQN